MTSQSQTPAAQGGFLSTIAGKITVRMLLVASIPVLAVGALTVGSLFALADRADERLETNRADLAKETIGANQADQASLVLARMTAYVNERIGDATDWSRAEAMVEAASADYLEAEELNGLDDATIDNQVDVGHRLDSAGRTNRWLRTQIDDQVAYHDAILTNRNGFTVGYANASTDFTNADSEWWVRAWEDGAFLSSVVFDDVTGLLSFDIAIRVDDTTTRGPLGVLKVTVDVRSMQRFADEFADEATQTEVSIVSGSGLLLAETASDHDPERIAAEMPFDASHAEAYGEALTSADRTGVLLLEDTVGGFATTEPTLFLPRLDAEIVDHQWVAFIEQPASTALQPLEGLESLSTDLSNTARMLTFLIAGLVLAALALAFLLARLLADRIARPINQLRVEANRLADQELPQLVASLRTADASAEMPVVTPISVSAEGEVAELTSAFNAVRTTAVELAAEQVIGRSKDVSNVLLNLGRRNQQLVGRQLRFIDNLEHSESDPDTLRSLFVLDQMATRMRRNAESLLVLAGEDSPRRVNEPRPISEVLRAASGEVEDYARVQLSPTDATLIAPRIVNDLTHLLAELIENATNFSPPSEFVQVVGKPSTGETYTISIIDRGVGIPGERLEEANSRLRDPASTSDTTSSLLGLYVVARLAARHNINVHLSESAGSGLTAAVVLPREAIARIPAPITEVTGSTLSGTAAQPVDDAESSSWPPPKVEYKPKPPAPVPDSTPAAATAETDTGAETDTAAETDTGVDEDPGPAVSSPSPPKIDLPERPAARPHAATAPPTALPDPTDHVTSDDVHAAIAGLRSVDAGTAAQSSLPPASQQPMAFATTTGEVKPDGAVDDESVGLPIPPFKTRQSKRPVGVADVDDATGDAELNVSTDAALDEEGDPASAATFHVRRRIRKLGPFPGDDAEPANPLVTKDVNAAKSRADEVREKLTRFASGVEAARSGKMPLDTKPTNGDADVDQVDNNGATAGAIASESDHPAGNSRETVED